MDLIDRAPPAAGGRGEAGGARLPVVDAVRLLSIALVLALHLLGSARIRPPQPDWIESVMFFVQRTSMYGVLMFFVVSGFLITQTITRRTPDLRRLDLRGFYVRRAGRIVPLLLLYILLGVLALRWTPHGSYRRAFCVADARAEFDGAFWVSIFTFWFNWLRIAQQMRFPFYGLHWDILWSLSIEEQFYLLYPLLLRSLGERRRIVAALCVVVLIGPVARYTAGVLVPGSGFTALANSPAAFDLLALGALLAFLCEVLPAPARAGLARAAEVALGVAGAVAVAAILKYGVLAVPSNRIWGPSALGLALCLFLAVAVRRSWCAGRVGRALAYPGQFSYGAYMLHPMVMLMLWPYLRSYPPAAYALLLGATLCAAALSNRLFEEPANRLVRRLLRAQ